MTIPVVARNFKKDLEKKTKALRSPMFYVGDKYKLMPQLKQLFPINIKNYYDIFCGGGSASINIQAENYFLNDVDSKIIELHQLLQENSKDINSFISRMHELIQNYGLSLSVNGKNEDIEKLKQSYVKTYFAHYNKASYLKLRDDYNKEKNNSELLYLLLVYGFNHMIRFNKEGKFNLPVGNVDWNKNVTLALKNYANWYNSNNIYLSKGMDFEKYVTSMNLSQNDFLYFDPPYLISFSDYNRLWNEHEEKRLYKLLDELDNQGIKWGLSNMLTHKGKTNDILLNWASKYNEFRIESNYISRFDNTIKENSKEVYITNYSVDE